MKMVAEKLKTPSRDDFLSFLSFIMSFAIIFLPFFVNKELMIMSTIYFVSKIESSVVMKMIGFSFNIRTIGWVVEHADMIAGIDFISMGSVPR